MKRKGYINIKLGINKQIYAIFFTFIFFTNDAFSQ